jgi:glycosyltransferase involved in cell wall biosynthesis
VPSFSQRSPGGDRIRPRVLLLSAQLPWPAIARGRRRELELIKRISERFDLHLVVVSQAAREDLENATALGEYCQRIEVLPAARRLGHAQHALEPEDSHLIARHRSERATGRVGEILARGEIDLVHVEGFYLMQHVPEWVDVPVLLIERDMEYDIERHGVSPFADPLRDLDAYGSYGSFVRRRTTKVGCWSRATRLAAVTPKDRDMISAALPGSQVSLIPDGADHIPHLRAMGASHRTERSDASLVTVVANFACATNLDAAIAFCQETMPLIRAAVPNTHLLLVGDAPPPEIQALECETVRVSGDVPDVVPYVDAADVVACPLRIGGGSAVGATEALRRGKAIVATSVAAEALTGSARASLVIADGAEAFAGAVASLLQDPPRRRDLEGRATRAATALPRWNEAAQALSAVYEDLLAQARVLSRSA